MSSYRFCRTDDMPLLVEAYNRACLPHLSRGSAELDLAGLKRWVRDLDLWRSSCMIARDDAGELIGVLLGCKRPTETLVLALGVHPDHLRQGHARHLLSSLSSKLAILGPPRLVAEVPADDARARAFFEACGWVAEERLTDYALDLSALEPRPAPDLVQPITASELIAAGALALDAPRPWARAVPAVLRRDDVLGLAIASPDGIAAWVLWRAPGGGGEVQGIGAAPGAEALLPVLLGQVAARCSGNLTLPGLCTEELAALPPLGLRPERESRRYAASAASA